MLVTGSWPLLGGLLCSHPWSFTFKACTIPSHPSSLLVAATPRSRSSPSDERPARYHVDVVRSSAADEIPSRASTSPRATGSFVNLPPESSSGLPLGYSAKISMSDSTTRSLPSGTFRMVNLESFAHVVVDVSSLVRPGSPKSL